MPICKDCDRKIDLPKGLVDKMTLDKFSKYISYHDQQQPLRDKFTETYRFDFGFGKETFVMDASHGFFKLKDDEKCTDHGNIQFQESEGCWRMTSLCMKARGRQ